MSSSIYTHLWLEKISHQKTVQPLKNILKKVIFCRHTEKKKKKEKISIWERGFSGVDKQLETTTATDLVKSEHMAVVALSWPIYDGESPSNCCYPLSPTRNLYPAGIRYLKLG